MFVVLLFVAIVGWNIQAAQADSCPKRGVVVLVPGTFNSVVPGHIKFHSLRGEFQIYPYFSRDIVDAIRSQGYGVTVVRGLEPFGDFHENGIVTSRHLRHWYIENCQRNQAPITLLGHSAGAFYSLVAASENADLPIRNVIMLATPIRGTPLSDVAFDNILSRGWLEWVVKMFSGILDFRGLAQVREKHVHEFLSKLRVPAGMKMYAVSGYQPRARTVLDFFDSRVLGPIFDRLAKHFLDSRSDGVVEVGSALGKNASISTGDGHETRITALREFIALDHSEQVMDYRVFKVLGMRHTEFIRQEQWRFYRQILTAVETQQD